MFNLNRLNQSKSPLRFTSFALLTIVSANSIAQTRTEDIVYMKSGGVALTMDVVKPAKPNRAAVIFMVSGGWISDHSMFQSFMPEIEKAFVESGFTVYEVVHGAQPRYKVTEIVQQVRTAVKFVNSHVSEYGIDSNKIGVSGISSGGHLALMIGGSEDSPVNAVAAIAPPTDLANWGKPSTLVTENPILAQFGPALGFDLNSPKSANEALAKQQSPIALVTAKFPPTLIVHGDADVIVPIQQAQVMDQELGKLGVDHKLEVVSGGGHDGPAFTVGVTKAIQWFKEKLLK